MKKKSPIDMPQLGEQEMETFKFVADRAPITVGDVAKGFGTPRNLARTTVLTVMERLRTKGYLTRRSVDGVYHYSPKQNLQSNLVAQFVERSLGGSLSPFVTYLADTGKLSETQIEELQKMIDILEEQDRKEPRLVSLHLFASNLWRASWQGGIVLLGVALFCVLVARVKPSWSNPNLRYWLWWIGALQLLVRVAVLPIPIQVSPVEPTPTPVAASSRVLVEKTAPVAPLVYGPFEAPRQATASTDPPAPAPVAPSLLKRIEGEAWKPTFRHLVVGSRLRGLSDFRLLVRTSRLVRGAQPLLDPRVQEEFDRLKAEWEAPKVSFSSPPRRRVRF